ncbi:MAG: extracellular solute-binding protein [Thermoplasmata archaeon]
MKRRTFLKGTVAAGAVAAAGPFVLRKAGAYEKMPEPGPDELRIIESAKKLKKNVDLSFIAWGGHSKGEMQELAAAFKKQTGIGLGRPIDIGFSQLSQRAMAEALSRSGKIDLLHVHSDTVPTLFTSGLAAPLDDYMKAVDFDYSSVGTFVEMSMIEGKTVGLVTDGNCHTYFVRKDILENPDNQKRYADKYGDPLKFATTWKEYLRQGAFFGSDPNKLTGFGNLRARRWGFWWFFINYYNHGLFPFNDDLSLNFDNDTAEAALEAYLAEKKYVLKDLDNWGTAQNWLHLGGGKGYQSIYWGGILPILENPKKSKVAGKWAHGAVPANVLPGGRRIARTCAAGPPLVVVNNYAKNVDAAAHLAMWWTSRRNSTYIVGGSISTVHDPWREEHFTDPEVRKGYTPAGTDAIYLNQQINSPMVRTTGAQEFNDTLDKNISDAWLGVTKSREALKRIEKDWHKIIRRVGKSRMQKDVKSYRDAMPKVDVPKVS